IMARSGVSRARVLYRACPPTDGHGAAGLQPVSRGGKESASDGDRPNGARASVDLMSPWWARSDRRKRHASRPAGVAVSRPRLLLADDHPSVLAAAIRLLSADFDIVGTAGDGSTALGLATRLEPDVAVLDVSMPGLDGIEVARRLGAAGSKVKIVVLTVHDDRDVLR